jgi:hypothetical protein
MDKCLLILINNNIQQVKLHDINKMEENIEKRKEKIQQ